MRAWKTRQVRRPRRVVHPPIFSRAAHTLLCATVVRTAVGRRRPPTHTCLAAMRFARAVRSGGSSGSSGGSSGGGGGGGGGVSGGGGGSGRCPLTDDEWEGVVPHLEAKTAFALALTSVHLLIVVGSAMVKSTNMRIDQRQDVVDLLGRTLRRGLAAGHEARVARALASQAAEDVHVHVRRVAVQHIGYVLHVGFSVLCTSSSVGGCRPGGFRAVHESATSGARNAMIACVGDVHVITARMAAERDSMVRERMSRWYPESG